MNDRIKKVANQAPDCILSWSGHLVDVSGEKWRLGSRQVIHWNRFPRSASFVMEEVKEYIKFMARNKSPVYAKGQYEFLKTCLALLGDDVQRQIGYDEIGRIEFDALNNRLRSDGYKSYMNYTDAFRRWYCWCADMGFAVFSPEVAFELELVRIGRNETGSAVLSDDPNLGPLRDEELTSLATGLRYAQTLLEVGDPSAPLSRTEICCAWLLIALGSNPKNVSLLEEDDFQKEICDDGSTLYWLRVPRIKKRGVVERSQFKNRKLSSDVGKLIEVLIDKNRMGNLAELDGNGEGIARPIIRRENVRQSLLETPFSSDAFRYTPGEIGAIIRKVSRTLGLKSVVSGGPLNLSPRRLRYTFATRLVQEGASPLELAEALDHSDSSYIMVYFNVRSDAVRRLDKALALALGPRAQAFMGLVVRSKADTERGHDPASLIFRVDQERHILEPVGNCGNFGFCGLYAPIACYTCRLFRPWLDAPHEQVLDDLLAIRARRLERGADPKLTQMHDESILAVGDVIERCSRMRNALSKGSDYEAGASPEDGRRASS